jgi:hypothetical protein
MPRANDVRPEDLTPPRRIDAHLAEYGNHAIDYDEAFDRAIPAVVSSEDDVESPRSIVRADAEARAGQRLSDKELDRVMRELVSSGSFELLGVGESNETGDDPKKRWIFQVNVDTGTDHGFWAAVHRDTGKVHVSGFN